MIRDQNPIALRVPPELKEMIKNAAIDRAKEKGIKQFSMNGEVILRLEASFKPPADLSQVSLADLVRELLNRNVLGKISVTVEIIRQPD